MNSKYDLFSLFGGIFSTLDKEESCSNVTYLRAENALVTFLDSGLLDFSGLTPELVDWIDSPMLDEIVEWHSYQEVFQPNQVLILLCLKGYLNLANFMLDKIPLKPYYLLQSCSGGNLELTKAVYQRLNPRPDDLTAFLLETCETGYLNIFEWLYSVFPVTNKRMLDTASEYGHDHLVSFILSVGEYDVSEAIRLASEAGHLSTVRLLIQKCTQEALNNAFLSACKTGKLEICSYLADNDIRNSLDYDSALRSALVHFHPDTVRFLRGRLNTF